MANIMERPRQPSVRLAASHVADAIAGTHDGHSARSGYWYGWWYNLGRGRNLAIASIMLLCFFEKPSWCFGDDEHLSCGDPEIIVRGVVSNLPIELSLAFEILVLVFLLVDAWIKGKGLKMGWKIVKHDRWMGARVFFVTVSLIAVFVDIGLLFAFDGGHHIFRLAPILRAGILISVQPQGRETFVAVVRAIPDILNIMILAIMWVLLGAWIAYLMLGPPSLDDNFATYVKSVNSLQILLTTANYPDVMIPAYTSSRFAFTFFFFFIVIGLYFLLPLTLAVVYNNYSQRKRELDSLHDVYRGMALNEAFNILAIDGEMRPEELQLLLRELNAKYKRLNRVIDPLRERAIMEELTEDGTQGIGLAQFGNLCTVLEKTLHLSPESDIKWLTKLEQRFKLKNNWLRRIVLHRRFTLFVNSFVIVYAILLVSETVAGHDDTTFAIETALICFFTGEAALLIWALGIRYFRKAQTLFDFFVLILTWIFFTLLLADVGIHDARLARLPMVARSLQFFRLLYRIRTVRVVSDVFVTLVPRFTSVGYAMMCIFTFYAIIGVQAFGGLIQIGDPHLQAVTFGPAGYYVMNMNDFSSALVTLFAVMVVNNWFIIRDGFAAVTNYWAACFFFIPFYILTVIIVLNLTIAFIIEAFIGEFTKRSVGVDEEFSKTHGRRSSIIQAVMDVVAPNLDDSPRVSRVSPRVSHKSRLSRTSASIPAISAPSLGLSASSVGAASSSSDVSEATGEADSHDVSETSETPSSEADADASSSTSNEVHATPLEQAESQSPDSSEVIDNTETKTPEYL